MKPFDVAVRVAVVAVAATIAAGCAAFTQDTVLKGAVARVEGDRVLITPTTRLDALTGDEVLVYERVEQKAIDPYRKPWHPLKLVGSGVVTGSGPDGVWIELRSGAVLPMGEVHLRREIQ